VALAAVDGFTPDARTTTAAGKLQKLMVRSLAPPRGPAPAERG
jgi:hypothetical protein